MIITSTKGQKERSYLPVELMRESIIDIPYEHILKIKKKGKMSVEYRDEDPENPFFTSKGCFEGGKPERENQEKKVLKF